MKAKRASKQKLAPDAWGRDLATWIEIVREARLLHGEAAARAIWAKSPLPKADVERGIRKKQASVIRLFLLDCCDFRKGERVQSVHLYAAYQHWCGRTNRSPVSPKAFGHLITDEKISRKKTNGMTVYVDVALTEFARVTRRGDASV